jgi:CRP-like cAMP-binding protein
VPAFSHLSEDAIGKIVNAMVYESVPSGTVLCREGDIADRMFIVVSGTCSVTTAKANQLKCQSPMGILNELDIVGESMMCENEADRVRIATVMANATAEERASLGEGKVDTAKNAWIKTGVQMLKLSRVDYEKLVHSGVFGSRVQASIRSVGESRRSQNHEKLVAVRALRSIQGVRATSVESITRALAGGAKKDEDDWKKEKSREDIGEEAGSL